jgi:hemolysin activation/secretion protein
VSHLNVTGRGDILSVDSGLAEGRGTGAAAYSFPLDTKNTRVLASFSLDDARIVEAPFDRIDIKSKTRRASLGIMRPWLRDSRHSLVTSVGIEGKQSRSTLLGIPFSFSPGDQEGKSRTTVLNFGVEWRARSREQILVVGANFRRGLAAFGATINESGPDGRFSAFVGQVQYARRAGPMRGELLMREMVQLALDPLLAVEKMPVGGLNTVRGYRENRAVRDNGTAASIEWRVPVLGDQAEKGTIDPLNLRVAPFIDYGRSWDHADQLFPSTALNLCSAGIGLLWSPLAGLRADVYWARPLTERHRLGNDLQDKGIHFAVEYRVPLW